MTIHTVIVCYVTFHWKLEYDVYYYITPTVYVRLYQIKYVTTAITNNLKIFECGTGEG